MTAYGMPKYINLDVQKMNTNIPSALRNMLKQLVPKSGWRDLATVYANWSGVGFVSVLVADFLDNQSGVAYAAHYTDAVNAAIGVNFWLLISSIGLLLFCLLLPLLYVMRSYPAYRRVAEKLRFFSYMFFLVAFDEGALMIGILLATMSGMSGRADLIISKSFLFSNGSLFILPLLLLANSLLWWLGESMYNRTDRSYSGLVSFIFARPLKYTLPCYLLITVVFIALLLNQQ